MPGMRNLAMIYDLDPTYLYDLLPEFDFDNPPVDPIQFAIELTETMMTLNAIGLAANQVGKQHRLCVIRSDPVLALYNPIIVDQSSESNILEEGCCSFPGLLIKVRRPNAIRIRYTQPNGERMTKKYVGMTARIVCHEVDHLNGVTFQKRASRLALALAKGKEKNRL